MHSTTLDVASGVLLLSSVLYFLIFLKKVPKSSMKSSASLLSMSDLANSILTALVIYLHKFYSGQTSLGNELIYKNNQSDFITLQTQRQMEVEKNCTDRSVVIQYAVFFVPFTNAFLSLLCFSVGFYANASRINRKCYRMTMARQTRGEEEEDEASKKPGSSKAPQHKGRRRRSNKFATMAVIGQWLLPIIFGALFQSGHFEKIRFPNREGAEEESEAASCSLAANFPLENWMTELGADAKMIAAGIAGLSSSTENYMDNLGWPNPNSSKVDDVLAKVYHIIREAGNNDTRSSTGHHYNVTQLYGIADVDFVDGFTEGNQDFTGDVDYVELFERALKNSEDLVDIVTLSSPEEALQMAMKDRCVMPTRSLRMYLFAVLSLIYFVPILVSTVLLVISHYKCKEAADRLSLNIGGAAGDNKTPPSGWFPTEDKTKSTNEETEDQEKDIECSEFETVMCELSCKAEKTRSFLDIFKTNVLAAVVLWTPFFIEVISKVFFCGSALPGWMSEAAFLATVGFVTFRNTVYVRILKSEASHKELTKRNSVRPKNPA